MKQRLRKRLLERDRRTYELDRDIDVPEVEKKADALIESMVSGLCKPREKISAKLWADIAHFLARRLITEFYKSEKLLAAAKTDFDAVRLRFEQDANRIINRKDQKDKRAFQTAVSCGMESYSTKADAVRDMKANAQFQDYPEKTLRGWTSEIWTKPTRLGRPKKPK